MYCTVALWLLVHPQVLAGVSAACDVQYHYDSHLCPDCVPLPGSDLKCALCMQGTEPGYRQMHQAQGRLWCYHAV